MIYKFSCNELYRGENLPPFNEFILSWNGSRPLNIDISFFIKSWSPWYPYAKWGEGQRSFSSTQDLISIHQDEVSLKGATGFQVRVDGKVRHFFAYMGLENAGNGPLKSVELDIPGISQMTLNHERCRSLCSPVSTAAVLSYLTKRSVDPLDFAKKVFDEGFNIYGNWVLNVAAASEILGDQYDCHVTKLKSFYDIYQRLIEGLPVIVSVRGQLSGAAIEYKEGHLMVVRGYDDTCNRVLVMDPAHEKDTLTSYSMDDFMKTWNSRGNIAYLFTKN